MVQKQHSKTARLFSLKKSGETSESSNIIHRISAPLSRFHASRNHTSEKSEVETNHEPESPRGSLKPQSPSAQRKQRKKMQKMNRLSRDKQEVARLPSLTESSVDSSCDIMDREAKHEISETSELSYSENSFTSQGKDIPKIKTLFRRSLLLPSKEETPRLSTQEKNIENGRKSFLRGLTTIAKRTLEVEISGLLEQLQQSQDRSNRLAFTLASAYYYIACVEYSEKEYNDAELHARESLSILDDILISLVEDESQILQEKKKLAIQDSWLYSHWEINSTIIWARKSSVENQIGCIMIEKKKEESALEWLQRSIYSREKRVGLQGLASSYVAIGHVLVDSVKEQFNSLKQLLTMSLAFRFEVFFELYNLLSLAKSYAKTGIRLCKKIIDDSVKINGLSTLLEVQVIQTQMSSLQERYLGGISTARSTTTITNEKRYKKMEQIRNDIERVQRRLNKERNQLYQKQPIEISTTPIHRGKSVPTFEDGSFQDPAQNSKNSSTISSCTNVNLLRAPMEL